MKETLLGTLLSTLRIESPLKSARASFNFYLKGNLFIVYYLSVCTIPIIITRIVTCIWPSPSPLSRWNFNLHVDKYISTPTKIGYNENSYVDIISLYQLWGLRFEVRLIMHYIILSTSKYLKFDLQLTYYKIEKKKKKNKTIQRETYPTNLNFELTSFKVLKVFS